MLRVLFSLQRWLSSKKPSYDHYPLNIFEENAVKLPPSYGIIVLNYSKASLDKWLTETFWSRAKIRVCADGGSNELHKFTFEKNNTEHRGHFIPDLIIGDLDSIRSEAQQYYEEEFKVPIIKIADQDSTDFTKCLQELEKKIDDQHLEHIYVFCTFAGRFDQAISIIHTLYLYSKLNIFLISDEDITFLLKPGINRIYQIQSPMCGKYCSLIPFAGPLHVVTNGLQWNLNEKMELNFNTLISTSNTYSLPKNDFVTIDTPESIIWSMTISSKD